MTILLVTYDVREELDDIDRALDQTSTGFIPFETTAVDTLALGSDALLYVMAHRHAISVPTSALYFAEKVGVVGIARRDINPLVLADVNRALDLIAKTLRTREMLDREPLPLPPVSPMARPNEGPMATLERQPFARPPAGQKVTVEF